MRFRLRTRLCHLLLDLHLRLILTILDALIVILQSLLQHSCHIMNLLLSCHEDQDIALRQFSMDSQTLLYCSLSIVFRSIFLIISSDREHPCLNVDDRHFIVEETLILKILNPHSSTHDDQSKRMSFAFKRKLVTKQN